MGMDAAIIAIVLVCTLKGAFATVKVGTPSCNIKVYKTLRSEWASEDDPCQKKMSFELWALMKAEGNANDADAHHVRAECIEGISGPLRLELITPEDWDATMVKETCSGTISHETKNSALFLCDDASDLEVFCADDAITRVSRVTTRAMRGSAPLRSSKRRLQTTTSEAGEAHKVAELIAGLEALGCERTRGEGQTLCVMSDSYNANGGVPALEASGDLPPLVDIVKEGTASGLIDEGSAMMELVYDIASGANFKFNTAFDGIQAFADDVLSLASDEACDVIVDDISSADEPGFRDGNLSHAVDTVSNNGTLYFTSAGNDATAGRFTSVLECAPMLEDVADEACDGGVAAIVFNASATDLTRYILGFPTCLERITLTWDEDGDTSRDMAIVYWYFQTDGTLDYELYDYFTTGVASEFLSVDFCALGVEGFYISVIQLDSPIDAVDMMMVVEQTRIEGFDAASIYGHRCASKAISVAAMDWDAATGAAGEFDDPETASVTDYSSRGPCTIDSGSGIEVRDHPVLTAATGLQTSTDGFERFNGTSASAPVAAAIATIVRAACYPDKLVTYTEIMEMMTNYDYAIDVTSDADGAAETWGVEAGYSIISADQMLLWVAENCQATCPGSPSPVPPASDAPTVAPVTNTTPAPFGRSTLAPVAPTVARSTAAPVAPTGGKCCKTELSNEQRKQLENYDKGLYIDPDCVNSSAPAPLLCNYLGVAQECRGCYRTCDGANKYKHDHRAEVAKWDEAIFFNFCPDAEVDKFEDC